MDFCIAAIDEDEQRRALMPDNPYSTFPCFYHSIVVPQGYTPTDKELLEQSEYLLEPIGYIQEPICIVHKLLGLTG